MELVLHFMYVVAIKDRKAWMGDSPAEIAMIGFWNLIVVWLKVSWFNTPLIQGPQPFSVADIICSGYSCLSRGGSSVHGRSWMGSIPQRIWSAAW